MSNVIIARPLGDVTVGVGAGTGGENLLTPDPKEIWASGVSNTYAVLNLGTPRPFDTIFLGFTSLLPGAAWNLSTSDDGVDYASQINAAIGAIEIEGARSHIFARLAAPVTARYVAVSFFQVEGGPVVTAGIMVAALAFSPEWNFEWGAGRPIVDTGSKEALIGGGFGIDEGVVKSGFKWTLGDLSTEETRALYALARAVGETRPVLVVEDPASGLQEDIHYGVFDRFEPYERQAVGKTRWGLSMTEWT